MTVFWRDIGRAFRLQLRSPSAALFAVISISLGIGANIAVFSVINALLLRPLAVRDPGRLVALSTITPESHEGDDGLSLPMFEELQKRQDVFSIMFAWAGGAFTNFDANGVKYAATLNRVTGDYFSVLGIKPLIGRLIAPADAGAAPGAPAQVAVLDYRCWQSRYNGDPAALGKTILINGRPFTIIGVTPESFRGLIIEQPFEVTTPIGHYRDVSAARKTIWLEVVGRLRPGVGLEQTRARLDAAWPAVLAATVPDEYRGAERSRFLARRLEARSAATGKSYLRDQFSRSLMIVMALVAIVLAIACVNLASLMLARSAARRHEYAVRIALGATRGRLIREVLLECVMIAAGGAALGILVGVWTSHTLARTMFAPLNIDLSIDWRVFSFDAATAALTGVLFGLAPALAVAKGDQIGGLWQSARAVRAGNWMPGKLMVSAQMALSLVMVISAVLFVRSLANLRSADLGYRTERVLLMRMFPQAGRERIPNRSAYYRDLASRLGALPGVEAVSYSQSGPVSPLEIKAPVSAASVPSPVRAVVDRVGPGFFTLIGMRVLEGREFDWKDDERAERVVIISQSLASRLFPGQTAVGRKMNIDSDEHKGLVIIGVVNSASLWIPQSSQPLAAYLPLMQEPTYNQCQLDIRTRGNPLTISSSARRTLESGGHHYALTTRTLREQLDMSLGKERTVAMLSALLGAFALLIAAGGLYGLMTYIVKQRTAEIGIRMALGAQRGTVLAQVLFEAMTFTAAGLGAGVLIALCVSHVASGMVFGLASNDALSITVAVVILLGAALIAALVPAKRASEIDPMTALRNE